VRRSLTNSARLAVAGEQPGERAPVGWVALAAIAIPPVIAYFAAGRPVVFHGPPQSSPGRYVAEHQAAVCVGTPYASSVYNALYSLATQPELFRAIAQAGQRAFQEDFTLEKMRENYYAFLGLTDDGVTFDFTYEDSAEPEDAREAAS